VLDAYVEEKSRQCGAGWQPARRLPIGAHLKRLEPHRNFPRVFTGFFSVGKETDVRVGRILNIFLLKFSSYKDNIDKQPRDRARGGALSRGLR
jgi:hypothetical protein